MDEMKEEKLFWEESEEPLSALYSSRQHGDTVAGLFESGPIIDGERSIPNSTMKYAAGDNVQCYWDSIKFQAKVIKVDANRRGSPYLVHYQGWKSRWDEWVGETRLVGKGSGNRGGKKAGGSKKKIASLPPPPPPPPATHTTTFDDAEEDDDDPPPTLERLVEKGKVVYKTSDGKSLKSLAEMKRFCDRLGLLFDATDYDFTPPTAPKISPKQAGGAGTSRKGNTARSPPKKAKKGERRELAEDLKEIKRAIGGGDSLGVDVPEAMGGDMTANLLEEGDSFSRSPRRGRPARLRKTSQRISESGFESPPDPRKSGIAEKDSGVGPSTSPRRGRPSGRGRQGSVIKVKTAGGAGKGRKRRRDDLSPPTHDAAQHPHSHHPDVFHSDYEHHRDEGGMQLSDLMASEEGAEEFIEIQEHLSGRSFQEVFDEGGVKIGLFQDAISPPPNLTQQAAPKKKADPHKASAAKMDRYRGNIHPHPPKHIYPGNQSVSYGYRVGGSDGVAGIEAQPVYSQAQSTSRGAPSLVHHRPESSRTTTSTVPLQGIRVTGQAPASNAPSRILMKLKAPEMKKPQRFKASVRVGPDGMEYIDTSYSPSIHTGGRGRFGVVGSGPPPPPIIPERPEDFCHLPPEVVGDHCYGKTPPARVGGPVVTIRSSDDHPFISPQGKFAGYLTAGRIQVGGAGVQGGARTIRVLAGPPPLLQASQHHEASSAAAQLQAGAAAFEDVHGQYNEGMPPPVLEGYDPAMEVGFVAADIESETAPGSSGLPSTVALMPNPHHVPLLGDKLPANILEGVDDAEMVDPSNLAMH